MEEENLRKFTLYLEEEQLQALQVVAEELCQESGLRWSVGAVVRLALNEFLVKRGKLI